MSGGLAGAELRGTGVRGAENVLELTVVTVARRHILMLKRN